MRSSKSSSTCSSPLKSMEEVWNDINLSSLHHHHRSTSTSTSTSTSNSTTTAQTFHFQDFFSKTFFSHKDPPPPNDLSSTGENISLGLGSLPKRPSSTTTASPSWTSESDQLGFIFLENKNNNNTASFTKNPALDSSPALYNKIKRVQENGDVSSDLKHKRLMKNRESAARSRARKQAYTNELENEVARLRKENAKLKNQLTPFKLAAPTDVLKKCTLYRTLTAPF